MIDCTPSLFPTNGIGRVTTALVQALLEFTKNEHDYVLYNRSWKKKSLDFKGGKNFRLPLPKSFEGLIKKLGLIELLQPGVNIYHATDHYMPVKNIEKAIVTVHDLIFIKCPEKHLKIHEEMTKRVPPMLKKCRHIITCSEYSKNDMINYLGIPANKITVIPWGINKEIFYPENDLVSIKNELKQKFGISNKYFVSVSCSEGRKNTPMLLKCYTDLLKSDPDHDLVLVWNPPESIRKQYDNPRIHFLSGISDDDLRKLYSCASATVYPSHYEGFGLPVLESMSYGTPVVCSNVSSLPEVGGDFSYYIDPKQESSLLKALEDIDQGSWDLNSASQKGLKFAEQFTWENCAKETIKVYKEYQS